MPAALLLLGALTLAGSILAAVLIGEIPITPSIAVTVIAHHLLGRPSHATLIQSGIVWDYRLTRALLAACCGSGLAVSGAVLQALLRNSLAEPYTLGISAGASTGAVVVALMGVGGGLISLSGGAFAGGIVALLVVSALAVKAGGGPERIILAGVAGSQLFNAVTSYIVTTAANAEQARGVMFWLLGSLSGARWSDVGLAAPVTAIALLIALGHARALDAFTFGSDSALTLGINVTRARFALFAATSLVTAVMVSSVGSIGFVGLVVPHAARFLVGPMHGRLVPTALVGGAIFMVWADILSRILVPDQSLPIGVVTALIGAPCFALILQKGGRRG